MLEVDNVEIGLACLCKKKLREIKMAILTWLVYSSTKGVYEGIFYVIYVPLSQ